MAPFLRRLSGVAALVLVAVTVPLAPPAAAAPTEDPVPAAAGWLARQMVEGERFEDDFGDGVAYPDAGLTLDAVFAFAAAGVAGDNATGALRWLATDPTALTEYVGDEVSFSDAGRLAKVAYAAQVTGGDPTDVGGVDVLARLTSRLTPSGRFSDTPADADRSNAFGQSFALLALARTPAGVPRSAVDFLVASECPGGGFPLNYGQPTCTPDTDATAMVTQALALPGGNPAAAARGIDWLVSVQKPDGSFAGTGTTATPNSNSTGLAAQALRVAGRTGPADAAGRFLLGLQSLCTAPAEQRGAIAYDGSGFDAGNAERATAQAIVGLSGVGFAELTLAGAEPSAPTLACAAEPTPTPTAAPTATPTGGPGAGPTPSVTATASGVPTASGPPVPAPVPTSSIAPTPSTTVPLPVPSQTMPVGAGSLPNTGADVAGILWAGTGLVLVGGAAAVLARRRTS